jgi:NTP pyrophosphatase (non-canonical NTP hydrolase)
VTFVGLEHDIQFKEDSCTRQTIAICTRCGKSEVTTTYAELLLAHEDCPGKKEMSRGCDHEEHPGQANVKWFLSKPSQANMIPYENLDASLVNQFQYELSTIFTSKWFYEKPSSEQIAFLFAGIATEGGEVVDCYKKGTLVKGHMDLGHLTEELGDVMWHISNIATVYNIPLTTIMKRCMQKFRNKYPERYIDGGQNV